ncbi:hypothetical protein ACOMHN_021988 [Nucella lapillus]
MASAHPSYPSTTAGGSDDRCCLCQKGGYFLRMVLCGHVFCKACLEPNTINLSCQNLICPKCQIFGTSSWNIRGIARSVIINDLSQTFETDLEETVHGHRDESIHCQSCGAEVRGRQSFFCMQCKVILCGHDLCLGDHTLKSHYLVLRHCCLNQTTEDSQTCSEHGQELLHFCANCKKVLCESCLKTATHRRHRVESLPQSAERAKTHLKMAKTHLEPTISYLEWFYKDLNNTGQDISRERQNAENQIHSRAQELQRLIQEMEKDAVSSLVQLTSGLEQQRVKDKVRVKDRLCALRAKREHLTSALATGTAAMLVHMESNALDLIHKRSTLKKFTSRLPEIVQLPCGHNDSIPAALNTAMEKYIGFPDVQKRRRKAPVMNVMLQFRVKVTGSPQAWRICSGGRDQLVWVCSSWPSQTRADAGVQLVDMSDFTVHNQQELKGFSRVGVDLVNADHHSAIISGRQQFIRLLKGNTEPLHGNQNATFTVFCKGSLRACLRFSGCRHQILPSVRTLDDMWRGVEGFDITRNGMPVSMDSSESGQLFAVINNYHHLSLYRRGEPTPYSTYPSARSDNTSAKILDACFFKIENQEVLLVADETENDVIALDVHRGCRVVGTLTNRSGELFHPVALNVDPYTGGLLVLCSTGRADGQACLTMCAPTGVPLESRLEHVMGTFR